MKTFRTIFLLLALASIASAQTGTAPVPGEYKGVVRIVHYPQFNAKPVTRWLFRAVASVSESGEVAIGVNVPSAPIPGTGGGWLRFTPGVDGRFTFDGTPELAPADELLHSQISDLPKNGMPSVGPAVQPLTGLIFRVSLRSTYSGFLQADGNVLKVNYDDINRNISYLVAPPRTTYSYVFRRTTALPAP